MKRTGRRIIVLFAAAAAVLGAVYLGLAYYYIGGFGYGTWINGVYCTGKSVEEANSLLTEAYTYEGLLVRSGEKETFLDAQALKYRFDFTESLRNYLAGENPFYWIKALVAGKEGVHITPRGAYSEEALILLLKEEGVLEKDLPDEERTVRILDTPEGYILENRREHVLDNGKALDAVRRALDEGKKEVDLEAAGCFLDLPLSAEMKGTKECYEKIRRFQQFSLTYVFGEEERVVTPYEVSRWIAVDDQGKVLTDESGRLVVDAEAVDAFMNSLAAEYDTYGSHIFTATSGRTVTVKGGTYGNQIDRKAEALWLTEALLTGAGGRREPVYSKKALYQGKDDIGPDYIEVDMGSQMLYYYKERELVLSTPVVTGSVRKGRATPEGVDFVYAKQTNRILRGPGYASHVDFWMPVRGGIGLHDASWRSQYGGEIYKTGGSHGCINMDYEAMEQLYSMVEIGTPVILFNEVVD